MTHIQNKFHFENKLNFFSNKVQLLDTGNFQHKFNFNETLLHSKNSK